MAQPLIRRREADRTGVLVQRDWQDRTLPALVRAQTPGLDAAAWVRANRDTVDRLTRTAGAVLLRDFAVAGADAFREVMAALSDDVLGYGERSSPRTEVRSGVYTSTEHPPDQPIVLHNEQSYTLDWPLRIVFFCDVAPAEGGRTPLADSRAVLARLSPAVVDRFERHGVRYVRNYLPGISLPWREAFQTDSREEVERYCRATGIHCEWLGEDQLRTHQVRPAVHRHPHTGERTWFNHALFFHVTSLPPEVSAGLLAALDERDLPYQTYYGDGRSIEDDVVDELRAAYEAQTVAFDWKRGDVLVVENMIVAHAREPFRGPRRILAAMADPRSAVTA